MIVFDLTFLRRRSKRCTSRNWGPGKQAISHRLPARSSSNSQHSRRRAECQDHLFWFVAPRYRDTDGVVPHSRCIFHTWVHPRFPSFHVRPISHLFFLGPRIFSILFIIFFFSIYIPLSLLRRQECLSLRLLSSDCSQRSTRHAGEETSCWNVTQHLLLQLFFLFFFNFVTVDAPPWEIKYPSVDFGLG